MSLPIATRQIRRGRPVSTRCWSRNDFPGENLIGKRITFGGVDSQQHPEWFEIVGVTVSVKAMELRENPEPEL